MDQHFWSFGTSSRKPNISIFFRINEHHNVRMIVKPEFLQNPNKTVSFSLVKETETKTNLN